MLSISPRTYAWEVSLDDYTGGAAYRESADVVESDWSAFYNKTTLHLGDYDNKEIEGNVHFGISASDENTETWVVDGAEYQTNDMSFQGTDTGLDIGWALPVDMGKDGKAALTLTPLLGYRWKSISFTRDNFIIQNTITEKKAIYEDYDLHFVDLGGRVSAEFADKLEFFARSVFGIGLHNGANNSEYGTVDGDAGLLLNFDTGVSYSPTENVVVRLAFTCETQHLYGGANDTAFWPNNSLDTYGGTVSVKHRF